MTKSVNPYATKDEAELVQLAAEAVMGWKAKDEYSGPGTEGMISFARPNQSTIWYWPKSRGCAETWNPLEFDERAMEMVDAVGGDFTLERKGRKWHAQFAGHHGAESGNRCKAIVYACFLARGI